MAVVGHGVEIVTSSTRPASPFTGQMIYDDTTSSFLWYTGSTWVGVTPAGTINPFAGTTSPPGWIFCYGQSLNADSNPEYADLFDAIGTTYGGGGSNAFNVPDLRGRTLAGKDDMGGSAASRITSGGSGITGSTLGASGGSETHTLTTAQLPAHSHAFGTNLVGNSSGFIGHAFAFGGGHWGVCQANNANTTQNRTGTNNAGSGNAHGNTQPTIILNYIIKL